MTSISTRVEVTDGPYAASSHWAGDTKRLSRHAALKALRGTPMLYAMRVPVDLIKIGYSTALDSRVRQLHGEILALVPGDRKDEQAIHSRLSGLALYGREFYPPDASVLAVVNEMRANCGLDPLAS